MQFTIFCLLLVIGFLFFQNSKIRRAEFKDKLQNDSERRVSRLIKNSFNENDYFLLNNITLPIDCETTQIDHILISKYGVFVIETKNYKGWIFLDRKTKYWKQVLYKKNYTFKNPLHQNYKHYLAVVDVLHFLPKENIHSLVVFSGDAEFKTKAPDNVIRILDLEKFIRKYTNEVMTINEMQYCIGKIEYFRKALTRETDIEHVNNLKMKYSN